MFRLNYKWLIMLAAAGSLSACQTVKIPDFEFMNLLEEGFEQASSIGETPDYAATPAAPTNIRSADDWDAQAKALIYERDANNVQGTEFIPKTDAQIAQEKAALKARVHAYKADDPVGGF